jgi:pimeloyl-ACP methyl ester carboxylesterase
VFLQKFEPRAPEAAVRDGGEPLAPEAGRSFVRTSSGRLLAYTEAGSGPDVLLLHGTLTTSDDMRVALFEHLQDTYHVVALDRPSHGLSDRLALADASLWSQAETIREAVQALGLKTPLVCGHSYGGAVALSTALAYPELTAGVVALAPVCFPEPRLEHLLFGTRAAMLREAGSWIDPLLLPVLWNAMFLPQAMPERFSREFPFGIAGLPATTVAEGESANSLPADLMRSIISYPTCRVPVTFVTGSADIVVGPWHSATAAAMIPKARLRLLPGVGHMLHHVKPDAVAEALTELASDHR